MLTIAFQKSHTNLFSWLNIKVDNVVINTVNMVKVNMIRILVNEYEMMSSK